MSRPSLRFLLLRRLAPAMLAILAAGAGTAYWVAVHSATQAYDRSLFNTAVAIAGQLRFQDGKPSLQMNPQARTVALTDKFDRIFFAVHGPEGELLDGDPDLPMPPAGILDAMAAEDRVFYDGIIRNEPVRVAALRVTGGTHPLTIITGETLVKRNASVREIIVGMLAPELLLVLATFAMVWFGIRSGLAPLAGLREELAGRSQADLRPLTTAVPEEMDSVAAEINNLLLRLDRSLRSQRNFVSDAAHQLRTPIAALQAQVEAAIRETATGSKEQLERILAAARRLSHLVDQLLALARAEPSQSQSRPVVDIEAVVHGVAEVWVPLAIDKGIDLGFDLSPARVRGNSLLLREMLANLVENALRHTPRGGMVNVASGMSGWVVWLTVEDSGPGIAPEEREKVFERFYQPAGSTSDGCGLGLAIVREIARQHGGQATVETSATLGGAKLSISLPAADDGPD